MKRFFALPLSAILLVPSLSADQHVVPLSRLQQQVMENSYQRSANLVKLRAALEIEPAQKVVAASGYSTAELQRAASLLSDEELSRLAARAEKASNEFAAGALSNQDITYILIAVVTAIVVILIVGR